MPRRSKL
ncbi:hypothetical protein VTL71DRAFT_12572 [Oculimacula yallundae]